jgi:hypothetical protein
MPNRRSRYDTFSPLLHELKLNRQKGNLHMPANMTDNEFEEIIKEIDKHYAEGGTSILNEGSSVYMRIREPNTREHLKKLFKKLYRSEIERARNRARSNVAARAAARISRVIQPQRSTGQTRRSTGQTRRSPNRPTISTSRRRVVN